MAENLMNWIEEFRTILTRLPNSHQAELSHELDRLANATSQEEMKFILAAIDVVNIKHNWQLPSPVDLQYGDRALVSCKDASHQ